MSGATGARLVAALGAVCAIASLWTNAGALGNGTSAYFDDGTLGALMLAAALVVLVLIVAAERSGARAFDVAGIAVGALLFGLLLFNPVFWAPKTLGHLGAAAWLGLCSALGPLALLSLPPADTASAATPGPARPPGLVVALAGAGLTIAGAVQDAALTSRIGYWTPLIRGLGICMIVLAALTLLLLLATVGRDAPFASDAALAFAGATLGFALYEPAYDAFGHFGVLGRGAWLSLGGAALLLIGVLLGRVSPGRARVRLRTRR